MESLSNFVDVNDRRFLVFVNDRFREYLSPHPDKNAQPCFGKDGKVKKRGPWDTGPQFSTVASSNFDLMPHQKLIRDFFKEESPYRGLLIYHGIGSGKTCTAIAVAEQMKTFRQIVIMCPASLKDNFVSELKKCGGPAYLGTEEEVRANVGRSYYFLAYDAPNLPAQINKIPDGLNNKLLIVDEVHGLISMMLSASIKGRAAFQMIMNATNLRLLLMSGTPVINDTFEIGIMANLLTGYLNSKQEPLPRTMNPSLLEDKNKHLLFNSLNEFYYYFVDMTNDGMLTLKNEDALKRRLNGLVSYFGGVQPRQHVFPSVTEHVVTVPMSEHQFELYNRVRILESESEEKLRKRYAKSSGKRKANVDLRVLFSNSKKEMKVSNFRAFSRQFSNFAMPTGIPRPIPRLGDINAEAQKDGELQGLAEDDMIDVPEESGDTYTPAEQRMLDQALEMLDSNSQDYLVKRLPEHSPKMHEMLKRIAVSPGPVYVYSQFRRMEGIGVLSLVLKAHGMIEYGWRDPFFKGTSVMEPLPYTLDAYTGKRWGDLTTAKERANFRPLTYMFWPKSSAKSSVMRNHLLSLFNSEANKTGQVIRAFLSTKAGSEGVNLMNVRQVHLTEPYWNLPLLQQAAGRAIRMCSHATLPPADRQVDVYNYITTVDGFQTNDFDSLKRPQSTDQFVRDIAIRKANLTNQALQLLKDIAMDCRLNYNWNSLSSGPIKCYDFQGIGKVPGKTFALDLSQELTDKDIRTDTKIQKIKLKRVKLFGTKYRVNKEDLKLIKRFMRGLFAKTEQQRIPLYHDINVSIIGYLILKYPNISALEAA